jgi:hypothetical protein
MSNQLKDRAAELAGQIARIDADADYQTVVRGEKKKKEREEYQRKLDLVNYDLQLLDNAERQKRLAAADPRIEAAIRWARDEKIRTQKELSSRGMVEKTIFGFGSARGWIETNEPKINARVAALDAAIKQLESLKLSPVEDVAAEIARIQSIVPVLDVATERIECKPGMAAALQE